MITPLGHLEVGLCSLKSMALFFKSLPLSGICAIEMLMIMTPPLSGGVMGRQVQETGEGRSQSSYRKKKQIMGPQDL